MPIRTHDVVFPGLCPTMRSICRLLQLQENGFLQVTHTQDLFDKTHKITVVVNYNTNFHKSYSFL